ncbi:MAG: TRAP transporter substrate-binding protein DctP [Chloroflexota bacterium]
MKRTRHLGYIVVVMLMVVALVIACAPTPKTPSMEPVTLLINTGIYSPDSLTGRTAQWFGDEVTRRTDGLITFEYVGSFSLTKPGQEIDGTKTGLSDFSVFPNVYYPTKLFLNQLTHAVFGAPTDPNVGWEVVDKLYQEEPALAEEYEKYGNKLIGPLGVINYVLETKTPVTKLEDLEGQNIAISGHWAPKIVEATGATPLPTTLLDRPTALQTGMLDGSILPWVISAPFKLYEFAPYRTGPGWGYWAADMLTMNLELFNSLPDDIQEILLEVGREAGGVYMEMGQADWAKTKATMEASGVTFTDFSDEEMIKWGNLIGNPVADAVKEGEAMGLPIRGPMETYLRLCKEAGHKFPREWTLDN